MTYSKRRIKKASKTKIVSDGTALGTRLYVDGKEIRQISKIEIKPIVPNSVITAVITVHNVELELENSSIDLVCSEERIKVISYGQINKGDRLVILSKIKDARKKHITVKEVLNKGTDREEIILNQKENKYFITSMLLDGKSWVKEAHIVKKF